MSARQYKPFIHTIKNIPLIVYPVKDENPLQDIYDSNNPHSIQEHLNLLYNSNSDLLIKGNYHIVFV